MSLVEHALLAVAGFVAAVVNVVAGGGSFLTLPLLIFFGLPAADANGTNRVGILAQGLTATWGFHRAEALDWRFALRAAAWAGPGVVAGTWLALDVGELAFRRILATLMLGMTLLTLADPRPRPRRLPRWALALALTVVGFYAGFIQAGVGFLVLAVTTWAGLDLVRGNAVKVLTVLALTVVALGIFAWGGRVQWEASLALALGSAAGGLAGARLTVRKGDPFVRLCVVVTLVLFALRLWFF